MFLCQGACRTVHSEHHARENVEGSRRHTDWTLFCPRRGDCEGNLEQFAKLGIDVDALRPGFKRKPLLRSPNPGMTYVGHSVENGCLSKGQLSLQTCHRVLVVDIGGTSVKVWPLKAQSRRFASGPTMTPEQMVAGVRNIARDWKYDVVSIGYPARSPRHAAAEPRNLGPGWVGFDFQAAFRRPVKVINDAAMQAIGSYTGRRLLFLPWNGARIGVHR